MRRYISAALITLCIILMLGVMVCAKDIPLKVFVDGTQKALKPSALARANTVYVPLTSLVKAVGGTVTQDSSTKDYIVTLGSTSTIVSRSRGIIVKKQFMVPMMVASNALDYASRWDKANKSVYFTKVIQPKSPPPPMIPAGGG
ncbi:MAG: hypothetical protein ACYC0V_09315 [Armatimonadota bacterium]